VPINPDTQLMAKCLYVIKSHHLLQPRVYQV